MKKLVLVLFAMVIGLLSGTSVINAQNLCAEYQLLWGEEPNTHRPQPQDVLKVFNKYMTRVRIGMKDKQVTKLIGDCGEIEVNRTVGRWGVHEQWVIDFWSVKRMYLYFENGVLTSWQN